MEDQRNKFFGAKIIFDIISYPLATFKNRLMISGNNAGDIINKIRTNSDISSFYDGFVMMMIGNVVIYLYKRYISPLILHQNTHGDKKSWVKMVDIFLYCLIVNPFNNMMIMSQNRRNIMMEMFTRGAFIILLRGFIAGYLHEISSHFLPSTFNSLLLKYKVSNNIREFLVVLFTIIVTHPLQFINVHRILGVEPIPLMNTSLKTAYKGIWITLFLKFCALGITKRLKN